jgi:hypothetical protein
MNARKIVAAAATVTALLGSAPAHAGAVAGKAAVPPVNGCVDPLAGNTAQPALPVKYSGVDAPSGGLRMESWIRVSRNGIVNAEPTHIWNTTKLRGYHGAVTVLLIDRCGNVIGVTAPRRFGVDGRLVGQHDRREPWFQNVGPEIATRVGSVRILHQRDSNSVDQNYKRYRDYACWAISTVKPDCPLPAPR